jgi:PAS domain S-box-containing protein
MSEVETRISPDGQIVRRRATERGAAPRIEAEILNEVSLKLSAELDVEKLVQAATDAATKLTGAKFGAFFHNVENEKGESYLLYTLSGASRESFSKFGLPRNTAVFEPTFRGTRVVRSHDILKDPNYGKNPPHHGMPPGHLPVRSYLAVPVISRSGEPLGGLFFGHPEPGIFTERAERLAVGIASHAAIALDNAGLFAKAEQEIARRKQAEIDLRESEERFRTIVETTPECVKVVASDGTLLHMNSSGLAMVGAECAETVIGKNVYDLIAPEFRDAFREFNERICHGEKGSFEFDITGLQGQHRHMETHAVPLRNPDGSVAQLAITRDITERKHSERATLLLGAIVDSSDDAIVSKDLTGIITSWNQGAERLFGYTANEVVGRSITILIPPDRLSEEPDILSRLQRGERLKDFETIRRRKDGTLLNISLTISPVMDAQGNIMGASKIARDITQRKRAEAALRSSESRFRQLADSMPQIVWTARQDGFADYYNEQWYRFTGFDRDKFGDLSWEPILHPDDVTQCRENWHRAVTTGEPYQMEYRFWDRHGNRWRWFMGRALPVRDEDGNIVKWFGTCTDIDHQKCVQDELRRANQDLEQFAYSASHDLQEPLRGVKIYSELLKNRYSAKLDGQALEFLHYLLESASRMEMLVDDLLAYTQVTKVDAPEDRADANKALTEVLENLNGAIMESGARITSDPLPSVRAHDAHLKQLFQNLLGNAIKYRNLDRIPTVHVKAKRRDENWLFSVIDNGIGIEAEYKKQIFGLFKRLHAGDEYPGTGIGLAICQRIVERYQGRIWVESEPGNGSTFLFTLPA